MTNATNITALAAYIAALPAKRFTMRHLAGPDVLPLGADREETDAWKARLDRTFGNGARPLKVLGACGTSGCIAGYALLLAFPDPAARYQAVRDGGGFVQPAAAWLGLDEVEAHGLFHDFNIQTPAEAAQRLRALLRPGVTRLEV